MRWRNSYFIVALSWSCWCSSFPARAVRLLRHI